MKKWEIKSIRKMPSVYKGTPRATIAVAGRSNCGKSTLINTLVGKKIALTSKTPGRTRKVQRFLINERFDLVDLPGYGFAKVGVAMRTNWRQEITDFLSGHGNLRCLLILVDIRRGLTDLDRELIAWTGLEKVRPVIILTKADKLSKSQQIKARQEVEKEIEGEMEIYQVSAVKKIGLDQLRTQMLAWWQEDIYQAGV
ncbi:ribosome biogenesis GTP-binding protein YihA/YsxC [bacterium]|nr:ribosome biogenesis GTP-binding protein YihA/YsxC [bacterium]